MVLQYKVHPAVHPAVPAVHPAVPAVHPAVPAVVPASIRGLLRPLSTHCKFHLCVNKLVVVAGRSGCAPAPSTRPAAALLTLHSLSQRPAGSHGPAHPHQTNPHSSKHLILSFIISSFQRIFRGKRRRNFVSNISRQWAESGRQRQLPSPTRRLDC